MADNSIITLGNLKHYHIKIKTHIDERIKSLGVDDLKERVSALEEKTQTVEVDHVKELFKHEKTE